MKNFIVYNANGKILRTGLCQNETFAAQAHTGEFVMEGRNDGEFSKIENGAIVAKTQAEIDADKPTPIPDKDKQKGIKKKEWDDLIDRIGDLDSRVTALE